MPHIILQKYLPDPQEASSASYLDASNQYQYVCLMQQNQYSKSFNSSFEQAYIHNSSTSHLMQDLNEVLETMGMSQYLQSFRTEGFDTWETLMDITESDMDALSVKLGHRRKLQRAIADARGLGKDSPVLDSGRNGHVADDAGRSDEAGTTDLDAKHGPNTAGSETVDKQPMATKRKYRRHPKPDEKAPERPPSAYVIFSNRMRDSLRGQDLSFTEIAKVVGERWQELSPEAKEPCERQAQALKEKYYSELAEYKKTPHYASYQKYLIDFKAKHAQQTSHDSKRPKTEAGLAQQSNGFASGRPYPRTAESIQGAGSLSPESSASPTTTYESHVEPSGPESASTLAWRSAVVSPISPRMSTLATSPDVGSFRSILHPLRGETASGSWKREGPGSARALPLHHSSNNGYSTGSYPLYDYATRSTNVQGNNHLDPSNRYNLLHSDSGASLTPSTPSLNRDDTSRTSYSDRPGPDIHPPPPQRPHYALPSIDTTTTSQLRKLPVLPPLIPPHGGASPSSHHFVPRNIEQDVQHTGPQQRQQQQQQHQHRYNEQQPPSPQSMMHSPRHMSQEQESNHRAKTSLATLLRASEQIDEDERRPSQGPKQA